VHRALLPQVFHLPDEPFLKGGQGGFPFAVFYVTAKFTLIFFFRKGGFDNHREMCSVPKAPISLLSQALMGSFHRPLWDFKKSPPDATYRRTGACFLL